MANYYELGSQLRDFLSGLLDVGRGVGEPGRMGGDIGEPSRRIEGGPTTPPPSGGFDWGPYIDADPIPDLYAPQSEPEPYTLQPAGIDNLGLSSVDTFYIPGRGEYQVNFDGYFQVARDDPTTDNWATAHTHVNLVDLRVTGEHPELGTIHVTRNPDVVSPGQVLPAGAEAAAAACRISTGARFEMPDMGMTLFNKEPILLMNPGIDKIPPVEDPNGEAQIFNLPLFDAANPNGNPVAYLKRLRYTVGTYVTQAQAEAFRA